ncbi:MAG TPA: dihydrolipoamide acetyltransferase family protein [Solirubrobacteraceae bacterium]|jgi:pyruvate dehydrogenase E2 component (dihydrolipoamide acetyltransferase)|nr:dihydrolipoamide acetyltransferase family protein [Solirubrobacteraceae bacterium]
MTEIVMPRLSDTMEEGTILRWLVGDGEAVRRGQEIVEIETDKATMTYESDLDGVLHLLAAEGDTLPVGAVIASVGSAGASTPNVAPETPAVSPKASAAAPNAPAVTPEAAASPPERTGLSRKEGERVRASPLARRIATERAIDLHELSGTGPGGRIVKADVEAAAARDRTPGVEKPTTAKGETTEVELSRTQQTIARRMAESKATIPHFALQADVDMEECVALRSELKRLGRADAPTYNDMVVKACALALREHPRANSSYRDGRLQLHSRVNVGVAVATDSDEPTGGALIVPTVFDADLKSLGEIARETRALAVRVREHSITPPELGGGTFTVSNLGMFGVDAFTAIVNPPQAAILSVGSVRPRAVVHEGEIVARQRMTVTLACDHRILYGADAARFLARIRELLEQPASLTL